MRRSYSLKHRVVVITGASSGIGRATALAFARCGAQVVLAARRQEALEQVAADCRTIGAKALVVPTDVTDSTAMSRLARLAYEAFGDIDVWINNAGTGLLGAFSAADIATHRRVVEINLHGTMNGAAAVLPYFLRQRRGILITNISVGGIAPVPFATAYTASKFGMRGFMASLRQELASYPQIHACSVFPACIDTPGYQHGANVSGSALHPSEPIFSAESVADTFVQLALRPRAEVNVGWTATVAKLGYAAAPVLTEKIMGGSMRRYLEKAAPAPRTAGNLFQPVHEGTGTSGGWGSRRSPGMNLVQTGLLTLAAAALGYAVGNRTHGQRRRAVAQRQQPLALPA